MENRWFEQDIWIVNVEKLAMLVDTSFDEGELRLVCFDLDIDYDHIPGRAKLEKVYELIAYLRRRDDLKKFVDYCRQKRPQKEWQIAISIPEGNDEHPPYKGLQSYKENDALYFFGREEKTAVLINRLNLSHSYVQYQDDNFLAVIGASGSGKSSLVRAGLVATWKHLRPLSPQINLPKDSENWPVLIITPADDPLESLISSLGVDGDLDHYKQQWRQDMRSLHRQARNQLNDVESERLLIVIDQFEELFTLCKDEAERKVFINNLVEAATVPSSCVIVIIILRADFYHFCAQYVQLRELLAKRQEFIGGLTEEELRQVIEGPAIQGNWELEPGLVDRILSDVRREPSILPLLSHVLLETWRRRNGRRLTLWGYEDAGGVQGAISATADKVYSRLSTKHKQIARYIFLRLTIPGEGDLPNDTRRPAPLPELLAHPESDEVSDVLNILARGRLITLSANVPGAHSGVVDSDRSIAVPEQVSQRRQAEIAHEALIRRWPQFQEWLKEQRQDLLIQRRLTADALDWQTHDYNSSYLYRGQQLKTALAIKDKSLLNSLERDFLNASLGAAKRLRLLGLGTGLIVVTILLVLILIINKGYLNFSPLPWEQISPDEDMVMSGISTRERQLYVGTESSGVWQSLDGFTWENISEGIPDITIGSKISKPGVAQLAVDKQNAERLMAYFTNQGIYERSTANAPWKSIQDGLPTDLSYGAREIELHGPLAVSLYDDEEATQVFVRQFLSVWRKIQPPAGIREQVALHIGKSGDIVYLGTDQGLYRANVADEWQWQEIWKTEGWVHIIEPAQKNDCGKLPMGDDCLYLAISDPTQNIFTIYRWSYTFGKELITSLNTFPREILPAVNEKISAYVLLDEHQEVMVILADGKMAELQPFPDGGPVGAIIWINPDDEQEIIMFRNSLYRYRANQKGISENEN